MSAPQFDASRHKPGCSVSAETGGPPCDCGADTPHDWSQYPPSKALGSSGWMQITDCEDGSVIEAYVLMDRDVPVQVRRIVVGPRGGIHQYEGGNAESLRERAKVLRHLADEAERIERLR